MKSSVSSMPKISVIVPVYNVEKYLDRCITSILDQSFKDFELILVNDGSTDCSGVICDSYAKRDSRIWAIHKNNEGVAIARNTGLEVAKGDWLCFFDADDSIPNNALEYFIEVAQEYEPDIIVGDYMEISDIGKMIVHRTGLPSYIIFDRKMVIEKLLIGAVKPNSFFGSCCVKMFKKNIFTQHDLRFTIRRRAEDWLMNVQYLEYAQSAVVIDKIIYNYFRNGNSAMSKCFPEQFTIWEENNVIRNDLIKRYGYNINMKEHHTAFTEQVIWHCLQIARIGRNTKEEIYDIFHKELFIASLKDCEIKRIPITIRAVVKMLQYAWYELAYIYIIIYSYVHKIKRGFTS